MAPPSPISAEGQVRAESVGRIATGTGGQAEGEASADLQQWRRGVGLTGDQTDRPPLWQRHEAMGCQ